MFEERQSFPVGLQVEEYKVYPYDLLRAESYFPMRKDILQYNTFSDLVSVEALSEFRVEFRDKSKGTEKYVSDIKEEESMKKVSNAEHIFCFGFR